MFAYASVFITEPKGEQSTGHMDHRALKLPWFTQAITVFSPAQTGPSWVGHGTVARSLPNERNYSGAAVTTFTSWSSRAVRCSASYWNICLSPPTLILCLSVSLGATICHCRWLVMLLHACWGLVQVFGKGRVTSVEWSPLRLQETSSISVFSDTTQREKSIFCKSMWSSCD